MMFLKKRFFKRPALNRIAYLKKPILSRTGFGLWQAIMIILIISGLMVVVLKYSRIAAKHTADTYVREQLELYLNSAVEMTLLAISDHNRTTGSCISAPPGLPSVTKKGVTYSANVNITKYYLFAGSLDAGYCGALTEPIQSEETHGMVLMEIEALATVDGNTTSRILRRTLQRP